jgi:hypothetical protein
MMNYFFVEMSTSETKPDDFDIFFEIQTTNGINSDVLCTANKLTTELAMVCGLKITTYINVLINEYLVLEHFILYLIIKIRKFTL